jgi:hypothetical protein
LQVAIYGYNYTTAARATWNMLQELGVLPLLNNSLMQLLGLLGCALAAAACAAAGLAVWLLAAAEGTTFPAWAAALLGGLCGLSVALPLVEVLESAVTAVFVCYAREPDFLRQCGPRARPSPAA